MNTTEGNLKVDIGFDDLDNGLYQTIIYSEQVNTHSVAHVFGKSLEECEANAKLLAASKAMLEALLNIRDGYPKEDFEYWAESPIPTEITLHGSDFKMILDAINQAL